MQRVIVVAGLLIAFISVSLNSAVATEKSVSVNGFEMQYVEEGVGPTLILVHGWVSDNRTWSEVIPLLAKDFRVIAPTQRYFGKTKWQPDWPDRSNELAADDLAEFIQKLGTGPVHLAGWSFGGRVAHLTAMRHSSLVRSAYLFEGVINRSGSGISEERRTEIRSLYKKTFGPYREALKKGGSEAAIGPFIDAVGKPGAFAKLSEARKRMHLDNAKVLSPKRRAKTIRYKCDDIKAISVPVQLAIGTDSAPIFQLQRELYPSCLPAGSIVIIEGATHGWPRTNPQAFATAVKKFASTHQK